MTQLNSEQLPSDVQLVFRIKNGDAVAFKELFFKYCQPLIRFAYRFTREVAAAEDMVQEVFLKTWQNRRELNPQLHIKSYLYRAVRNQALNLIRHEQIVHKAQQELRDISQTPFTPEDIMNATEIESAAWEAIEELPEKCRLIFSLNRFDNLTYAEIAELLELSVKTIETQMGRALQHLRKKLSHLLQLLVLYSLG